MPATSSNLALPTPPGQTQSLPKPRPALRNQVPRGPRALVGRRLSQGQRFCSTLGVAALARLTSALGKRSTNWASTKRATTSGSTAGSRWTPTWIRSRNEFRFLALARRPGFQPS